MLVGDLCHLTLSGVLHFVIYNKPSLMRKALEVNLKDCFECFALNLGCFALLAKKLVKAVCWCLNDCCIDTQETSFKKVNSFFTKLIL